MIQFVPVSGVVDFSLNNADLAPMLARVLAEAILVVGLLVFVRALLVAALPGGLGGLGSRPAGRRRRWFSSFARARRP